MASRINIAIIAGQLVVGGAERQLYLWLSNLDRERFNPVVITLHPGHDDYWEKPVEALDISLIRIDQKKNRLARLLEIIRHLRVHQPGLIHGWHTFSSVYAGLAGKILRSTSLGGIRSSYSAIKGAWATRLMRLTCDAVLANSEVTAEAYRGGQKIKKQPVFTVQNAMEPEFEEREAVRKQLSSAYGLPEDALWVASIGRVDPLKRFDVMVLLASMLADGSQDVRFLLIGDGPEKPALEKLAEELGVTDKFTFTGEVPSANRWMKGFDIFCFPSVDEGLPNAVMEAAAAGQPILGWRLPYMAELFPNNEMVSLVEPFDMNKMADALKALLQDPELRAQMGFAAQSHVNENFSLERYIYGMGSVYESLLKPGLQARK